MPIFTVTGGKPHNLWLVDGSTDFGMLPANTINGINHDCPIWLKVGNWAYGEKHILHRHGHWIKHHKMPVPDLVYLKLGQSGQIHCAERESRIKVNLSIHPSALIVLDYIPQAEIPHLSITTMYNHQGHLDGDKIGRYKGRVQIILPK